jgi:hypothetical protein
MYWLIIPNLIQEIPMKRLIFLTLIILGGVLAVSIISFFKKADAEAHFWKWFALHENEYYNYPLDEQELIFDRLSEALSKIDRDLTFEFGPTSSDGKKEFVISAGGIYSAFPSVIHLVSKAPPLERWKITAFRPRTPGSEIHFNDVILSEKDVFFRYGKSDGKIDIVLFIKGYEEQPNYDMAVYLLLDSVLGEYDVETQIGGIERRAFDDTEENIYPITELAKMVDENKKAN